MHPRREQHDPQAELATGKTYYVSGFTTPALGGSTNYYLQPLRPGAEAWEKRVEWLAGCQRVEVNPEAAHEWSAKYAKANERRVERLRTEKLNVNKMASEDGE